MPKPSHLNKALPLLLLLGGALLSLGAKKSARFVSPLKKALRISSKFGERKDPFYSETKLHTGTDIAVAEGSNVYAVAPGRVSSSYSTVIGGKQLVIVHDNGWKSGYAHLKTVLKKVGQKVDKGDIVALTGSTGHVTGPHLHFTLRDPQGKFVDPEKYIKFIA